MDLGERGDGERVLRGEEGGEAVAQMYCMIED